jgi:large subunit ribosomal protein L5
MLRPLATNVNPGDSHSADPRKGEEVTNPSADPDPNAPSDSAEAVEIIEPGKTKMAKTITQLKAIQIHIMAKDTLHSRATLLVPMFQLRAISGETRGGGGYHTSKGVELVRARKNLPQWKIRRDVPCGVKVTLRGEKMYDFLGTLVEFVLPRLREWNGVPMPAPSANRDSPSMTSGVVSFGLKGEGVEWFPQVEVNLDLYTKMTGMYIHFITNEKGRGSQNKARTLLSGFQIPFARK